MEHVMDDNLARNNPEEYERWMEIYRNHPEMGYESLGLGAFVDPTPNHYQTRRQMVEQEGAPGSSPHAIEFTTGVRAGPWLPGGGRG
jgi:hypothetical protein